MSLGYSYEALTKLCTDLFRLGCSSFYSGTHISFIKEEFSNVFYIGRCHVDINGVVYARCLHNYHGALLLVRPDARFLEKGVECAIVPRAVVWRAAVTEYVQWFV